LFGQTWPAHSASRFGAAHRVSAALRSFMRALFGGAAPVSISATGQPAKGLHTDRPGAVFHWKG